MQTSHRPLRALGAVGLAAVLTLSACGGGGDDDETASGGDSADETTTTEEETTTTAGSSIAGGSGGSSTTTEAEGDDETTTTTTTGVEGELRPFSFDDDFTTDTGWLIGCDAEAGSCALVQDGRLAEALDAGSFAIDQHEQFDEQILTNLTISTTILDFSGEPEAGIVCHYDPETSSYYDFTIRGDGTGSVFKWTNGEGEELDDRFEVPFYTGGRNEFITATCTTNADGSVSVTMEANFEVVVDVTDDTDPLPPGQIGLVTYGDPSVDATVSFDDLEMDGEIYVE